MQAAQAQAIAGQTRIATTRSEASLARRGIALMDNWGVKHFILLSFEKMVPPKIYIPQIETILH